jgi:hypothetical protein
LRWGLINFLQTAVLPISASQVARIRGMSHWHLANSSFLNRTDNKTEQTFEENLCNMEVKDLRM